MIHFNTKAEYFQWCDDVFVQSYIRRKDQPIFTNQKDYICNVTFKHRTRTSRIAELFQWHKLIFEPTTKRRIATPKEKVFNNAISKINILGLDSTKDQEVDIKRKKGKRI